MRYIYEGVLFIITRLVHILKLDFLQVLFFITLFKETFFSTLFEEINRIFFSFEEINRIGLDMIQLFPKFRI